MLHISEGRSEFQIKSHFKCGQHYVWFTSMEIKPLDYLLLKLLQKL